MFTWSWLPRPINLKDKRPVFITGAPRCGSSWVGEVLSNCNDIRYVYEPFNFKWIPALQGQLDHFSYLDALGSPEITKFAENSFQGRQGWKQLVRSAYRGYLGAATRTASNVVVKDPTASLMSAWIAEQFNAQILFIMRHPCGFASSLDALDWKLNVNSLINQKTLMQDHLEPFRDVLNRARNDKWLTRGAIWASIHFVFTNQMKTHPDWYLYKYEEICNDPPGQYASIVQRLGLELSLHSLKKIQSLSATDSTDSGSTRRNSKNMPDIWKQRMAAGEIDAVMGIANEFGLDYY